MFRNLADCLETLEDAGSRYYTLNGPGVRISYQPDEEAAATPEACLQRFEKDFNRLGPGMYTVEHKKAAAANRNPASFRFVKAADGAAVGAAADTNGFLLADMQLKMQQLQFDQELRWLKRDHEDQIRALKAKQGQPDGYDKMLNIVGQFNQLAQNAKSLPAAGVAGPIGPATPVLPAVPVDEQETVINDTVQALHAALGDNDATTLTVLRKIGEKARQNPDQIVQLLNFL